MIKKKNKQISVRNLKSKYEKGLIIDPSYQRNTVWSLKKKRGLILTCLREGWSITDIHLVDKGDGNFSLMDGKQRLTTLCSFINNDFALARETRKSKPKFFKDLLKDQRNNILRLKIDVKYYSGLSRREEVRQFQLINSGTPLSKVQLRKAKMEYMNNDTFSELYLLSEDQMYQKFFFEKNHTKEVEDFIVRAVCITPSIMKGKLLNPNIESALDKGKSLSLNQRKLVKKMGHRVIKWGRVFLNNESFSVKTNNTSAIFLNIISQLDTKTVSNNLDKIQRVYKLALKKKAEDFGLGGGSSVPGHMYSYILSELKKRGIKHV